MKGLMKKIVMFTLIALAAFYYTPYAIAESTGEGGTPSVGHVLLRGVSNVGLGILSVPKNIVYQNAQIPVLGIITGTLTGALVFVWREIAGVTDLVSFGFAGHGLYFGGIPDMPWTGPWLPPEYN